MMEIVPVVAAVIAVIAAAVAVHFARRASRAYQSIIVADQPWDKEAAERSFKQLARELC